MGTAINGYDITKAYSITKAYGQFRIEQKDGTVTVYDFLENCVPLTATLEYEQLDVGREINLKLLYCGPEEPLRAAFPEYRTNDHRARMCTIVHAPVFANPERMEFLQLVRK